MVFQVKTDDKNASEPTATPKRTESCVEKRLQNLENKIVEVLTHTKTQKTYAKALSTSLKVLTGLILRIKQLGNDYDSASPGYRV
jgi:ubiquinone biosynthesis protein COQ9